MRVKGSIPNGDRIGTGGGLKIHNASRRAIGSYPTMLNVVASEAPPAGVPVSW